MSGLTADALLEAVRDFSGASSNEEDSADARLLRLINREQELRLTALLAKAGGRHRMATLDYTVSGTTYAIPTRAIAAGLKQIECLDANGNAGLQYEFPDEQRSGGWPSNGTWYFQENNLIFYAAPLGTTLRLTYYRRLSELVKVATVGVITTINVGGVLGTIAVSPAPSPVFPAAATRYDFVRATPHFDILAMDKSATYSAGILTFTASDVPSTLAVGDYICLAGKTAVCQAPLELHPVLAQLAVVKWLESKGDPRLGDARDVLKELAGEAMTLLKPRTEVETPIVNPNSPGWGAARWNWRRGSGV